MAVNIQRDLERLMGDGDEAKQALIQAALDAGKTVMDMKGQEACTSVVAGSQAVAGTTQTALAGWELPTLVYAGNPIHIELEIPAIVIDDIGGNVVFHLMDAVTDTPIITAAAVCTTSEAIVAVKRAVTLPIANHFELSVGDELDLYLTAAESAGTVVATVETYVDNAIMGTVVGQIRAVVR